MCYWTAIHVPQIHMLEPDFRCAGVRRGPLGGILVMGSGPCQRRWDGLLPGCPLPCRRTVSQERPTGTPRLHHCGKELVQVSLEVVCCAGGQRLLRHSVPSGTCPLPWAAPLAPGPGHPCPCQAGLLRGQGTGLLLGSSSHRSWRCPRDLGTLSCVCSLVRLSASCSDGFRGPVGAHGLLLCWPGLPSDPYPEGLAFGVAGPALCVAVLFFCVTSEPPTRVPLSHRTLPSCTGTLSRSWTCTIGAISASAPGVLAFSWTCAVSLSAKYPPAVGLGRGPTATPRGLPCLREHWPGSGHEPGRQVHRPLEAPLAPILGPCTMPRPCCPVEPVECAAETPSRVVVGGFSHFSSPLLREAGSTWGFSVRLPSLQPLLSAQRGPRAGQGVPGAPPLPLCAGGTEFN